MRVEPDEGHEDGEQGNAEEQSVSAEGLGNGEGCDDEAAVANSSVAVTIPASASAAFVSQA